MQLTAEKDAWHVDLIVPVSVPVINASTASRTKH